MTQAKPSADQPKTAKAEPLGAPEDPQARDVNDKINLYVQSMKSAGRTPYVPYSIDDKIRRQQDPKRRKRIRTVSHRDNAQMTAATDEPGVQPAVPEPQALTGDQASNRLTAEPGHADIESQPGLIQPKSTPVEPVKTPLERDAASAETIAPVGDDPAPPVYAVGDDAAAHRPIAANAPATVIDSADTSLGSSPTSDRPERAPVLDPKIRVSAGPEPPASADDGPDAARPGADAAVPPPPPVDTLKQRRDELLSRLKEEPDNLEDQFNLRMIHILLGREDRALAPIDGTGAELEEMIQAFFRALIAAQSSPGRDPAAIANDQLEKLEELRSIVRARADLLVSKVELCTGIEGFGWYTPIESTEFQAGAENRILVYVEVDNFRSETTPSGMYRTLLSVRQSLLTKSGEELWSTHDANIEDIARQRRRDFFLTLGPWSIPKTLGPGSYILKVEVEDVLAGKINSGVAKFKMVP